LSGQTIYLKFPSTNIVGGGLQSLAAVPAFSYTVTGRGQAASIIVSGSYNGRPPSNSLMQSYVFASPATLPASLTGSRGTATVAATAATTFNIQQNATSIATMTFAASASTATFMMNATTTFSAGDVLTLVAPSTADATLANLAWTFLGFA